MVELGMITAPSKKLSLSEFTRLDRVVPEKGKYTGALDALRKERKEGRYGPRTRLEAGPCIA